MVFETDECSQVVAKYLSTNLTWVCFRGALQGVDRIVWRCIEDEIEGYAFKLNDAHYREFAPKSDWLGFRRHKERKFGRGCLEAWLEQAPLLQEKLAQSLIPFELMLQERPFLLRAGAAFCRF